MKAIHRISNMTFPHKNTIKREMLSVLLTVVAALISAFGLHVFVYPSDFAPSGVDGIATVLQELTHVNAGVFTLAINLPLLIAAYFILKKRYVIYTVVYTVLVSVLLILFGKVGLFQYVTHTDKIIPAIFGGIAQGLTGLMLRIGASAGGVDVMACMIQRKMPYQNVEKIIAFLSYAVVAISYFVYWDVNSILLSVVEIFVCEKVTASVLRTSRNAVEFKIVTDDAEAIGEEILYRLRHAATVMPAEGMFSGEKKSMILCVVNYRQIPEFLEMMRGYPDIFVYYSDVMGVRGNFDWRRGEERNEDRLLREGRERKNSP